MRKILTFALAFALMFTSFMTIGGLEPVNAKKHTHKVQKAKIVNVDNDKYHERKSYCSCGKLLKTEKIKHSWSCEFSSAPSKTQHYFEKYCRVCKDISWGWEKHTSLKTFYKYQSKKYHTSYKQCLFCHEKYNKHKNIKHVFRFGKCKYCGHKK